MTYIESIRTRILKVYHELKKYSHKNVINIKEIIQNSFEIDITTVYRWLQEDEFILTKKYKNKNITSEIIDKIKILSLKKTNPLKIKTDINREFKKNFSIKTIKFILKTSNLKCNKNRIDLNINNFIVNSIKKDKILTALDIKCLIQKEYNVNVSKTYIYNILHKNNITYKKIKVKTNHYTLEEQYEQLQSVKSSLDELKGDDKNTLYKNVVSYDEMSVITNEHTLRGWNEKGKECIINKKGTLNSNRFTIGLMVSPNNDIHFKVVKDGMKTDDFIELVKEFNTDININNNKTLFLDNASIHRSKKFMNYVKESKTNVLYNVPYHSDKNPVEYIFSKLRKCIQKYTFETIDDLEGILISFKCLLESENDIKNSFKHAFSLFDKNIIELKEDLKYNKQKILKDVLIFKLNQYFKSN